MPQPVIPGITPTFVVDGESLPIGALGKTVERCLPPPHLKRAAVELAPVVEVLDKVQVIAASPLQ